MSFLFKSETQLQLISLNKEDIHEIFLTLIKIYYGKGTEIIFSCMMPENILHILFYNHV